MLEKCPVLGKSSVLFCINLRIHKDTNSKNILEQYGVGLTITNFEYYYGYKSTTLRNQTNKILLKIGIMFT